MFMSQGLRSRIDLLISNQNTREPIERFIFLFDFDENSSSLFCRDPLSLIRKKELENQLGKFFLRILFRETMKRTKACPFELQLYSSFSPSLSVHWSKEIWKEEYSSPNQHQLRREPIAEMQNENLRIQLWLEVNMVSS